MNKEIKVSIIVPVYKVEKYLKTCIDSLLNQTLEDIEIICINDGSPDNCLQILKDYKEKYKEKNIVIIDKKNEGVWKGRIDGIKLARGEYIAFVDSDDYVDVKFVEKLYNNIKKNDADISVCGFKRIDSITGKILSCEMGLDSNYTITMDKNPEDVISINTALWNKIYKASILKNMKELQNPPRILEDMMFLTIAYLNAERISFVNDYLYNYMVIPGSAMQTLKNDDIERTKISMLQVKNIYAEEKVSKEKLEILSCIAFLHFAVSLMLSVFKNDKKNFNKHYNEILNYLNKNFHEWKKSEYLNVFYTLKHKRVNLKVAILKKIYKLHMFRLFLQFYNFITRILKIDIKW